ncbi:MAG: NUDIX domain-containing protein [Eubacterium sp.]|nr:NUDIX domain-containing protein [Eubacterium sp.]
MQIRFYDEVEDSLLKFAVVISKTNGQFVFCKHKERDTYEVPGGHRELNENIFETAKRELNEETGAVDFDITPICVYSVMAEDNFDGEETFGMLYYADIRTFEEIHSEIEKIIITDTLPQKWTYPLIQPELLKKAHEKGFI